MAIGSSGHYSYQTLRAELIIREAYELVGIPGTMIVAEQLESAMRSINFLLSSWTVRNVNLWAVEQGTITLRPGVREYLLPEQTLKVIQASLRTSNRIITTAGTAKSNVGTTLDGGGGGDAKLAFDNDITSVCTQTSTLGNISYDYGQTDGVNNTQVINYVGILSKEIENLFSINIMASNDPEAADPAKQWDILETIKDLVFTENKTAWYELSNTKAYRYYKIQMTAGTAPLSVYEIYLNRNTTDLPLAELNLYEYLNFPNKGSIGRPSVYAMDYRIIPKMYLWQVPSNQYNTICYSSQNSIQTLESYTESINVPLSFYDALIYGLATRLAAKYLPEKMEMLSNQYEMNLSLAIKQNTVNTPLTLRVYDN